MYSCNRDLKNIDINNVEAHRRYQDSIINLDSSLSGKFLLVKKLIYEYKELKIKELDENDNYNYYLARLYGKVREFPVKGFWIDTTKNKIINEDDYLIFYDSSFYFAEKSLMKNENNISAMFVLALNLLSERDSYYNNNSILPFSGKRDEKKWQKRYNFILENALKFTKFDSTKDKYLSKDICGIALAFIDNELISDNYKLDINNEYLINRFYLYGQLYDYLQNNKSAFISFNKQTIESYIYPSIMIARKIIKRRELIANTSFKHKYFYFDANSGYSSLIELWTDTEFTIVSYGGFNYHGTYFIKDEYIYFTYANKSMVVGDVVVDADESVAPSKIKYEILDDGTINLITYDGSVYRQKDN